jgi:protein tyrosine phosphatase (PTP) superfamily phosphohydrolase (DUF442 family)
MTATIRDSKIMNRLQNVLRTVWNYTKLSIERRTSLKLMGDSLENIFNFRRLSDTLITAGQPTEQQLAIVQASGCQMVVNLAKGNVHNALADERSTVESLGMKYVHIPVDFNHPTQQDFEEFCALYQANVETPLLVHCAANFRVSVFMYLYRRLYLDWSVEAASEDLDKIWTPNEVWQTFIQEMESRDT